MDGTPARTEGELGALLHARRKDLALTQAQIAERADVSRAFVIDLEHGRRSGAELGRVLAVIKALDLAIDLAPVRNESFSDALQRLIGDDA